jgi:hypothetical protein
MLSGPEEKAFFGKIYGALKACQPIRIAGK